MPFCPYRSVLRYDVAGLGEHNRYGEPLYGRWLLEFFEPDGLNGLFRQAKLPEIVERLRLIHGF